MKLKSKFLLLLILPVLLLTGCFGSKSPEEVSQSFWEAVISNNHDAIVEYSTLRNLNGKSAFNKNWDDYQVVTGKITIDAGKAEIETRLSKANSDDKEITTYLLKRDDKWLVDYARTAQSLEGDAISQLFGQLNQLGNSISKALDESSEKFKTEVLRLEKQLRHFAESTGNEANIILQQHAEQLKNSLEELARSIERALKDHEQQLTNDEKVILVNASETLHNDQKALSNPSYETVQQSSQHVVDVHQQLKKISNSELDAYKKQWRDWDKQFEAMLQSIVNDLEKN